MPTSTVRSATPTSEAASNPEPTSVLIRRNAGVADPEVTGEIDLVDIGHHPGDPWISLIAHKSDHVWHVTYACAFSYTCADKTDHRAIDYALSLPESGQVDEVIGRIQGSDIVSGAAVNTFIGRRSRLRLNFPNFSKDYRNDGPNSGPIDQLLETLTAPLDGKHH